MLNKVLLIGRLSGDPVIKFLPSGTAVTEFGLVWNRRYKQGEEWKEESHFFDVKAFGKLAEDLAERLSKGYQVVLEGRLTQDRWTGQDGKSYSRVRIVAESVRIIRKPKIEEVEEEDITSSDQSAERIEEELKKLEETTREEPFDEDDEIPF
ncbi:single-stranded DNA-binding protein [Hydrogenivirga sp. 128-5-R1-1]|uniref:single-stranded DNA-binding protein n=1 Tax=Hydrogenivirga sp. 128-5-R1-1 TaxID=392423 RepID=UPI00015F39C0|nr:single-stranded DNA-binding protein [Hydrogenivirga sp. 128-5-R1-1]EDP75059.1 single stranded DNA-binding protein [Hydrogenivirga sp. 128-5-R1-1]